MLENLVLPGLLVVVVIIYWHNNPMGHDRRYRMRCLLNWLPLGLSYAFLYMGRYNLTVAKNALGSMMTKEDFGIIFGAGTFVYAFSFLVNGPLTDKIGGKRAMLIATLGTCVMNAVLGAVTYLYVARGAVAIPLTVVFAVVYSLNMYFQSYGAVAIVKVNAHWFHVKERGVFGGIFGTLISLGIYFAFDWGKAIVAATKANPNDLGFIQSVLSKMIGSSTVDQTWYVFFIPSAILAVFFVIVLVMVKDTPGEAGFADFDTGDASSEEMNVTFTTGQIIKKILTNPIILTVAFIEFCSGVMRNGIMQWYLIFANDELIKKVGACVGSATTAPVSQILGDDKLLRQIGLVNEANVFCFDHWGLLLCFAGIFGGFFAGAVSDKLFQSRRGPSTAMMYGMMVLGTVVMYFALRSNGFILLGAMAVFTTLCVVGVHGLLSGTATMDFGGRKGAATAVGMIDGFVYLGTGVQSLALGFITTRDWQLWPVFLLPFSIIGLVLALRIWRAFPQARRKGAK